MMMIFTQTARLCPPPSVFLSPQTPAKDTHRNATLESFSRFRRFGVCFAILILEEFGRKKKSREVIARVESSPIEVHLTSIQRGFDVDLLSI